MSALVPILFVLLLPLSLFKIMDQVWFRPLPSHYEAGLLSNSKVPSDPLPTSTGQISPTPLPSTPAPSVSASPTPSTSATPVPKKSASQTIDLSNWKLALPTVNLIRRVFSDIIGPYMSNPCARCGKERVDGKTWQGKIGASVVVYTLTLCPDRVCQKIVEKEIAERKAKAASIIAAKQAAKEAKVKLAIAP